MKTTELILLILVFVLTAVCVVLYQELRRCQENPLDNLFNSLIN